MQDIIDAIAAELKLDRNKVEGVAALLKEEYCVPFIARYRKEKTGGLDEERIRLIRDRFRERLELDARRAQALKTIGEAGRLTSELQARIENASSRAELEDWYMAYRSRRRTRSSAARAKGLEPLADLILKQEAGSGSVEELVQPFITAGAAGKSAEPAVATEPAVQEQEGEKKEEKKEDTSASSAAETPESTNSGSEAKTDVEAKTGEEAKDGKDGKDGKGGKEAKPESREVKDMAEALAGARDIIAERVAENAEVRKIVRDLLANAGRVTARPREGVDLAKGKFSTYANFSEPLGKIPSHRILAVMRGASEKQLSVAIEAPKDETLAKIKEKLVKPEDSLLKPELALAIEEAYERLLAPSMDNELRLELKRRADLEAIDVFARNLRALLLQAPFGTQPVLAIEPGLRNGCRLAVLGGDGKLLHSCTIHPHKKARAEEKKSADKTEAEKSEADKPAPSGSEEKKTGETPSGSEHQGGTPEAPKAEEPKPESASAEAAAPAPSAPAENSAAQPAAAQLAAADKPAPAVGGVDAEARGQAQETVAKLVREHGVKAIAIGGGTGSRETDLFIRDVLKDAGLGDVARLVVNEAGAALYSASPVAREELPELDAPARNAVFIGRRLQNPLAELVKLDPKAIGVGQYQHDVDQALLKQKLDEVVESCVNLVGVDPNTASAALLRSVCGLSPALARNIAAVRAAKGGFKNREELKSVPDFDAKAFEQAAGFLRIKGDHPLDATAIHPENYALVEKMAESAGVPLGSLIGNAEAAGKLQPEQFKTETTGEETLRGIIGELKEPGRDPRAKFTLPEFNDDIRGVGDLSEGMVLNGVVTNLTAFGAFVDVGVHQDGLVHISAITHKFIRDPSEALSVGQHVKVKVLAIDKGRKRISLSMKALQEPPQRRPARGPRAQGAASATGSSGGQSRQGGQGGRPPRGPRPERGWRGPRPAAATTGSGGAASPVASAQPQSGLATAGAGAGAGSGTPGGGRFERGNRHNRPAGGGRREGGRGEQKEQGGRGPRAPRAPEPGKPDYSKFFVRGKRKEKTVRRADQSAASRDEVRQVLRNQENTGTSLADLLKKAGVMNDDAK